MPVSFFRPRRFTKLRPARISQTKSAPALLGSFKLSGKERNFDNQGVPHPNLDNFLNYEKDFHISYQRKWKISDLFSKMTLFFWIMGLILTMQTFCMFSEPTSGDYFPENNPLTMPFASMSMRGLKIPIPPPPNKVSVVLMNYSRPRMIRQSTLMRTLLSHPNVGEVVILHTNPKTRFEFIHDKVVNVDATQENDEMGLSLRFYFCQLVKYEWVLHVDDDIEFDVSVISEILTEFNKNTNRIVGRFGRNLKKGSWFNGYTSSDTHKKSDVVLAKFMIMERDICSSFFEYAHLIWEDIVLNQGEGPMWNGEDIFMSLVANHVYGVKDNYAMDWLDVRDAPSHLKDYDYGKHDISGGYDGYRIWSWEWWQSLLRRNRHFSYKGILWQASASRLAALRDNVNLEQSDEFMTPEELDSLQI